MDEKELAESKVFSSWTSLFMVTGLSFLAFSGLLAFLNGNHINLFFKIGLLSTIVGSIASLNKWLRQRMIDAKSRVTQHEEGYQ